ncbi:MAG: hypothetical protein IKP47_00125, partial [Ruminococcus sp.]|nr:hypothetical protein [Ruminococcus sp.]
VICLHIFRHSTQILLAGRQPACVEFMHSDEKSDFVSDAQGLCGIALKKSTELSAAVIVGIHTLALAAALIYRTFYYLFA